MNESGLRKDGGADVLHLQQRSKSLMGKKTWRRSLLVDSVGPAGGTVMSACPERSDPQFEQGTTWHTQRPCENGSRAIYRTQVPSSGRSTRRTGM